jgi:hypothetical protein
MIRAILVAALLFATSSAAAVAQEPQTRAEELGRERAEKAKALEPPQQGIVERTLIALENGRLLERLLAPPEGFYPKLGTVTPGSGFAFGVGYRRPVPLTEGSAVTTFASGTFTRYWMLDARLTVPDIAGGRVFADLHGQRYEFPLEDFFGLGEDSRRADHVTYGIGSTTLGGAGGFRPIRWLSLGTGIDYLGPRVGGGTGDRPISTLFDASSAPGLGANTNFVRYELFADLNYRDPQGNPRRGGKYRIGYQYFDDRDLNRYGFRRFEADLQQYLPMLNDRRVIALHALFSTSDAAAGQEVPFYLQRTLGGPDDLRGVRRFRYRDRNMLLLQAEYRWEIFTAMDGALFYDAGAVAERRQDLSLDDLESDFGIGFRFGTINGVFLRIEGAFGSRDGKHFVFRFGHVF